MKEIFLLRDDPDISFVEQSNLQQQMRDESTVVGFG